jgi:hypothetical protein
VNNVEEPAQHVYLVKFTGERGGQIEAKPVHVHVQHPVVNGGLKSQRLGG